MNATGVQGAIGVTGWALDNVGVTGVKIYRNCLAFDVPASCQSLFGASVVFIGDAAFLTGARPDVAAAFTTYPNANRAGWGYLLLTSMLPHTTRSLTYGGQGAVTLYAVASDVEGNRTLLGRSSDPASATFSSPTPITMANDTIAKPFGAIDTPQQGETVSGILNNFGWALTPDINTVSGEVTDILVPTSGASMTVFIDSQPRALVTYNQCRGNVGNPVPTGLFCNDDVANIFGNSVPRAVLTTRTANVTPYRNLDVGRSAIGSYSFDTSTLTNGLHTIAWSVTDSAGRTEGIGSRFFNVSNGGAQVLGKGLTESAKAISNNEFDGVLHLAAFRKVTGGVWGRTGFDTGTEWWRLQSEPDSTFNVRFPQMGRLELWFAEPFDRGYLMAGTNLQELPVGARLDGRSFGWMPPVGYLGRYQLIFLRDGERVDVTATVSASGSAPLGESEIRMALERAVRSDVSGSSGQGLPLGYPVFIEGWAFDPYAAFGSGIGAVHVWARRLESESSFAELVATPSRFVGAATLAVSRWDIANTVVDAPLTSGFELRTTLEPGTWEVSAYVWNNRTQRWEDARSVVLVVR